MTPAAALATLDAAGVRVTLAVDGTVRLDAATSPPPDVLALARAHRDGIAALLTGIAAPTPAGDPITALIVRALAAGAWLQARPGGRLWCSDPARLPPELRRDLARNRAAVWELVRAGERVLAELQPTVNADARC